jgi:predicted acetyltransferase
MPLEKGKSEKTVSKNISELMTTKPGKKRKKAIATIAKKRGISKKKAKQIQAIAITKDIQRESSDSPIDKNTTTISARK